MQSYNRKHPKKPVTFYLEEEINEKLRTYCYEMRVNKSETVRRALSLLLQNFSANPPSKFDDF